MFPISLYSTLCKTKNIKGIRDQLNRAEALFTEPGNKSVVENLMVFVINLGDAEFFDEYVREFKVCTTECVSIIAERHLNRMAVSVLRAMPEKIDVFMDRIAYYNNGLMLKKLINTDAALKHLVMQAIDRDIVVRVVNLGANDVLKTLVKEAGAALRDSKYVPRFKHACTQLPEVNYGRCSHLTQTCELLYFMGARDFKSLSKKRDLVKYMDPMVYLAIARRTCAPISRLPLCILVMIQGFQMDLLHGF